MYIHTDTHEKRTQIVGTNLNNSYVFNTSNVFTFQHSLSHNTFQHRFIIIVIHKREHYRNIKRNFTTRGNIHVWDRSEKSK